MPSVSVFIIDNCLSSQNQDYLPDRYILQKDYVMSMSSKIWDNDRESLVGLIPIARRVKNNILTPTKVQKHFNTFLHNTIMVEEECHYSAFFQAEKSLCLSQLSQKYMYLFLSSPIKYIEELLSKLYSIAAKGICIKVVCFGDCIEIAQILKDGINFDNFDCLVVENVNYESFNQKVSKFFDKDAFEIVDPYMEEGLKRSMQQM